ncbi:hypothetical protein [Halorussus halobius]|uniref:hypothetical protein n=1 Tax=Halorussus halobius TaxID=1710537 RepID=UPI001092539F|nr:hypothetical protein [Halorussus halobius]
MSRPPLDPRYRSALTNPTWRHVLASYAMMVGVPVLVWAASRPLAGVAVVAALVGTAAGTRRASGLVQCFRNCEGFAFDVGDTARVTVTRSPVDDPN